MNASQISAVDRFATGSSLLEKQQMRTTLASDNTLRPGDEFSRTAGVVAGNSNRVLTNELRYVSATDLTEGRANSLRKPLNILVVDDDDGDRAQLKRVLKQTGLPSMCTETSSINHALEACEKSAFDCAIVDYQLPGEDGLAGVALLHQRYPYMALIMVTGRGDEAIATEAMRSGASDYIRKTQISVESIARSIENAVERAALLRKVAQQREEMEVFSQVLVHDLKGPIFNLLLFADVIEKSIEDDKAKEAVPYCNALSRAATRMNSLIDALQQYTRSEQRVVFAPLEMSQVMIDTLGNLEQVVQKRGARVTYGELPAVSGTPQLAQLMQNLIGNSIKYCEAETPLVHISAKLQEDNVWLFSVQDNGIGIPEEYAQQVFEPFQRLHGKGKYEGTGLGLATCKKIVERHGGTISCASKPGQGTTFCFTLHGAK
jgi:signal transduction histidine kinase